MVIILLFSIDAALVLNLCEFGSTLLVHAFLKVTAHSAVSFTDLSEDVRLVSLLVEGLLECTLFVHPVLTVHLLINLRFLVLLVPLLFLLHCLLEQNVSLALLVHVLQQVDAGLVFSAPLLFAGVPLLFVLDLCQLFSVALDSVLVICNFLVVALELLDFTTAGKSFIGFNLLDVSLTFKGSLKEHLIASALVLSCSLAKLLLGSVVRNELEIPLTVEKESLLGVLLLFLLLDGPLLAEHGLLSGDELLLLLTLDLSGLLLPV